MEPIWNELNDFFSSTTIHGFVYIGRNQRAGTRFIWTLIVLAAIFVASNFLYQTISGFDVNYTTTTVETRSIQEFPFPAVTFHSGEFNSKKSFLRTFLNQFEFTRYDENSPLRDDEIFGNLSSFNLVYFKF